MKRLLALSASFIVGAILFAGSGSAAASTASVCVADNGGICSFGPWDVYNNTWGPTPGTYRLHARGPGNWWVLANQDGGGGCGGCAVEVYDSSQWNYNNVSYSSVKYLWSYFSETMPTGNLKRNGFDAEATYDMFLHGSDTDEVMVWVDNQGQTPAGSYYGKARIHGQTFKVYVSGGTKSFVITKNETKGTVYYYPILRWLHDRGMLASSDTIWQFNFGWEICDTNGVTKVFTLHQLKLHQKF